MPETCWYCEHCHESRHRSEVLRITREDVCLYVCRICAAEEGALRQCLPQKEILDAPTDPSL